jgi:hypothetical protein
MDKILSAEEWIQRKNDKDCIVKNDDKIRFAKAYSIYLLEAFAEEVKSEAKMKMENYKGTYRVSDDKYPIDNYTDISIDKQSIDQLLTKFKEKL